MSDIRPLFINASSLPADGSLLRLKTGATGEVEVYPGAASRTATASFTLALTDASAYIRLSHADTPIDVTVPANADVALPVGSEVALFAAGAAACAVVASGGVTINSAGSLLTISTKKGAFLKKIGTDEWDLVGGLE